MKQNGTSVQIHNLGCVISNIDGTLALGSDDRRNHVTKITSPCKRHAGPPPRPSVDVYTVGNEGAILNIPPKELLIQVLSRVDE